MSWVHLTNVSGNRKVGPIKVTTTEKSSCPTECGVMDECYAGGGPLAIHWNKVGEGQRGDNWESFTKRVRRFHKNELWRHNQAGDLPPNEDGKLDEQKCEQLANAASHTNGWTYTHYNPACSPRFANPVDTASTFEDSLTRLTNALTADPTAKEYNNITDLAVAMLPPNIRVCFLALPELSP